MCSLPQAPSALVVSPKRFVKYETKTFWDVKPGKKVLSSGAHVSAEPAVGAHAYAEPAVGAHVYAEPAVEAMCTQNHAPKKKKKTQVLKCIRADVSTTLVWRKELFFTFFTCARPCGLDDKLLPVRMLAYLVTVP